MPTDQFWPKPLKVHGILSFFVFWKDNRFGRALGVPYCLGGAQHGLSLGLFYGSDLRS